MEIKMFGRVAVLFCVSNLLFFRDTATGKLDSVVRSCMCAIHAGPKGVTSP